jgi:hypothetical protein
LLQVQQKVGAAASGLGGALGNDAAARAWLRWAAAERQAWLDAVTNDPVLPARILPPASLGRRRGDDVKKGVKP